MTETVYQYQFDKTVEMQGVTDTLLLAVAAAEALHGRAKVNLDADFELSETNRTCRIDARNEIGKDIARIFVEYLSLEFGEDKFMVEQGIDSPSQTNGGSANESTF